MRSILIKDTTKDDREVVAYKPEDAKSISREVTFQKSGSHSEHY